MDSMLLTLTAEYIKDVMILMIMEVLLHVVKVVVVMAVIYQMGIL